MIELHCTPKGVWFVSHSGWGRRVGNYVDALEHAIRLIEMGCKQP